MHVHRPGFAGILIVLLLVTAGGSVGTAYAQEPPPPDTTAAVGHPNQTPYATDRSLAYHVLASPAYVFHAATRPLAWSVRYVERQYPSVFTAELPPRGLLPLVELGGPNGVMAGALLYDNQLFGGDHRARLRGLFGSREAFEARAEYRVRAPLGGRSRGRLAANVFADPNTEFFLRGNAGSRERTKTEFVRRQVDVSLETQYGWGPVTGFVDLLYEHVDTEPAPNRFGGRLAAVQPQALTALDFVTPRVGMLVDRTRGRPRTYAGTALLLRGEYTHALNDARFRYGRYVVEMRQYLPVGLLPVTRRLALRVRLEQAVPVGGGQAVPFYQLPGLGGQEALRGFAHRRFQDRGSLSTTVEYRYPIWSNLDAVVFGAAGQVFPRLRAVAADRFHWSYGGGVHLLNRKGLSARFEVAGSVEGVRTVLTVRPTFRQTAR